MTVHQWKASFVIIQIPVGRASVPVMCSHVVSSHVSRNMWTAAAAFMADVPPSAGMLFLLPTGSSRGRCVPSGKSSIVCRRRSFGGVVVFGRRSLGL